jgi:hypothetical protein
VTPEDELIELAARRARTAMADEKTGFGNLLQFLRDVTRQLARSRRTGEAFDLIVFETDAESDPSRIAARLRTSSRGSAANATHWSSAIRVRTTGNAPSTSWSEASDP